MTDLEPQACLFELQASLGAAARASGRPVLDAGRGQPNWVATVPREAHLELTAFALAEAHRARRRRRPGPSPGRRPASAIASAPTSRVGPPPAQPEPTSSSRPTATWSPSSASRPTPGPTRSCGPRSARAIPPPPGCSATSRRWSSVTSSSCVDAEPALPGTYQLFATEGGAAAMSYVFNTLRENQIVRPGDAIALATPIFTPYLQIPVLEDFGLRVVEIPASHDGELRFEDHALERLADPSIKAFFVINPGNPDSRAIGPERLRQLHDLIVERRPDLVIIADTAYAAFLPDFHGALADVPRNVICIHSFSKTFGATGNRLGVVAVHRDNVLDDMLRAQDGDDLRRPGVRYRSMTSDPRRLTFLDRMVADSRDVALHNIAGLATPDQLQMALFSLAFLLPSGRSYLDGVRAELATREAALLEPLGIASPGGDDTGYYALLDLLAIVAHRHGDAAADRLAATSDPWDLALRLASEHGVVVLPGQLFDAESWDVRISVASLDADELRSVGTALAAVLDEAVRQ